MNSVRNSETRVVFNVFFCTLRGFVVVKDRGHFVHISNCVYAVARSVSLNVPIHAVAVVRKESSIAFKLCYSFNALLFNTRH